MSLFVFHGIYRLVRQVTEKEMSRGHVVHIGEKANGYRVLVENPLGRYRCKLEDNIEMDLIPG
jgi:hypothetical protein